MKKLDLSPGFKQCDLCGNIFDARAQEAHEKTDPHKMKAAAIERESR